MIETLIDIERLRAIGLTTQVIHQLTLLPPLNGEPELMRVTEVQREGLTLHDGEQEHDARALPALLNALRQQQLQTVRIGPGLT